MSLPDIKNVLPHFQPIILADDQSVFAYEVLGREMLDGKAKSLGPFFEDPLVSDEEKLVVDACIREKSFEVFSRIPPGPKLFLNVKPSWAYHFDANRSYLPNSDVFDKYKIDPRNIVIEITEEELLGDFNEFSHIMAKYHSIGCMVAIDDFGRDSSSFERIAYLTPDIIKMDRSIVKNMGIYESFFEVSKNMASFGGKFGFDVLFEGVENIPELEACVAAGGRMYQGYFFAKPQADPSTEYENKDLFKDIIQVTKSNQLALIPRRKRTLGQMDAVVKKYKHLLPSNICNMTDKNSLKAFAEKLPVFCVKCWVNDHNGKRLSYSYRLGKNNTVITSDEKGKDIFFKPFFREAYDVLNSGLDSFLSTEYKSVELKEDVVTYMHRIQNEVFICVNIMAPFLR